MALQTHPPLPPQEHKADTFAWFTEMPHQELLQQGQTKEEPKKLAALKSSNTRRGKEMFE